MTEILRFLLTAAFAMALLALLRCFQRRQAKMQNGWHYLRPGPITWFGLVGNCGMSAILTYIYLFVGSARPDAESQMLACLGLAVGFNLCTMSIAYMTIVECVRWNTDWIERRTLLFQTRRMSWHQLAAIGREPGGYLWIRAYEGEKIRFSPWNNGFAELLAKIRRHLPTDLPPGVQELAQVRLARARAR